MNGRFPIGLSKIAIVLSTCLLGSSRSDASMEVARRAAPEIMIFYGGGLESRIVFPDIEENHQFLGSTTVIFRVPDLKTKSPISVALFWGMQWRPYARNPNSWSTLEPARASQHALFYPGEPGSEAVLIITGSPGNSSLRIVQPEGLRILSKRGMPVESRR